MSNNIYLSNRNKWNLKIYASPSKILHYKAENSPCTCVRHHPNQTSHILLCTHTIPVVLLPKTYNLILLRRKYQGNPNWKALYKITSWIIKKFQGHEIQRKMRNCSRWQDTKAHDQWIQHRIWDSLLLGMTYLGQIHEFWVWSEYFK